MKPEIGYSPSPQPQQLLIVIFPNHMKRSFTDAELLISDEMSRCFITNLPLLQGQNLLALASYLIHNYVGGLEAVNGSDILQNVILLDQCCISL